MGINGEPLHGASAILVKPDVKLQPEHQTVQKTGLTLKLAEIKASAHVHAEKATWLIGVDNGPENQEPHVPISPDEARSQLEALAKGESIPPSEFISRSKQVLQTSARVKKEAAIEQSTLQEQAESRRREIQWKIDERTRELDRVTGIKKIPAAVEKRILREKRSAAQKQMDQLNAQSQTKQQLIDEITGQEKPIRQKQEEIILNEIGQEIKAIRTEYEQLLQEIIQDGTLPSEIRENYIQQVLAPEVDKIVEERKLPNAKKDEFYSALRDRIDHRKEPQEQRQPYQQELDRFFTYEGGFSSLMYSCDPLLNGNDEAVVSKFVAKMAAEDIAPIKTALYPTLKGWEARSTFEHFFDNPTRPQSGLNGDENLFGRQILSALDNEDSDFPNMDFWRAVKSSKSANEGFGEIIQRQDQKYYSTILDKSLSDTSGGDIDALFYYPTPEAVRNLVILAAADYQNYRSVHSNWVLNRLQKQPDWVSCLDKTETVYPALKSARPVLESWTWTEYQTQPDIQQAAGNLASSLFEGKNPVDPRLTELATVALPNGTILDILTDKNVIQPFDATIIKDAQSLLDKFSKEAIKRYQQNDFTDMNYANEYSFKRELREELFALLRLNPGETTGQKTEIIGRFSTLSQMILDNKDPQALRYLTNDSVLKKLREPSLKSEDISFFLQAYKTVPGLSTTFNLTEEFCNQFADKKDIDFFKNMSTSYIEITNQLVPVLQLVHKSDLSRERALELPTKAGDILSGDLFSVPIEFPKLYLATDQDCEFFRKILSSYNHNSQDIQDVTPILAKGFISRELALAFPQQAPALMDSQMRQTKSFIINHGNSLLKDTSDIKFLNNLVGEFGKKSDQLIRGYQECLAAGTISTTDKELVPEFARQFRIISPVTLGGYKEAKQAGHEKVYLAQLQALAERMTGSGAITDEERTKPYYKDLLQHVYSNNSGNWTSYKSNESCPDRSSDLAEFKIKPRYEMDLLSQSEIRVKEGEILDAVVKADIQKPILDVAEQMNALGHDKGKIEAALQERVDKTLQEIVEKGGLPDVNLEAATTLDEKMFLILTDSLYGTRSIDATSVKNLVINYEFTTFEDVSDYIAGTSDRVSRANNQDYALFCEVGTFYSDRIKEVNRRLVQAAWNNPTIAAVMPEYFTKLAQETTTAQRKDMINRLQIDKLGASESFVKQAGRMLEKRRGRKYTPDEVKNIIHRYESFTGGLTENASTSPIPETKAFYGQLRSQRERTFEALKTITGQEVDPKQARLGEVNLQEILNTEANIREGKYDEEQFASYTVQRFIDLFENERTKIDKELAKFESLSGKKREVLYGYVTKSKESAHARMVGGVCVSGDNPDKDPNQNIWNMPNYLQMVFQEPDTLQCQGLALLHHFNEGGKQVLTASLNPSSTYLYSVDESALFNGIAGSLEQFAAENGFDMIAVPQNHTIRTNRTGGEFEKAMDQRVAQIGKTFTFTDAKQFSYHPNYQIQEMDIIWEKPKA